jgi:hypothetical protein
VYLILYTILFGTLLFGYFVGRLRLRSRYTIILFHVVVRLASQATGVAFGVVGYANISLLVAYFILGGESSSHSSKFTISQYAFFQQPKGTLHSFCVLTASSSRGKIITFPHMVHGLSHAFHKAHPCSSGFSRHLLFWAPATTRCPSYTFY